VIEHSVAIAKGILGCESSRALVGIAERLANVTPAGSALIKQALAIVKNRLDDHEFNDILAGIAGRAWSWVTLLGGGVDGKHRPGRRSLGIATPAALGWKSNGQAPRAGYWCRGSRSGGFAMVLIPGGS
jgi:hypothetical protein